MISPLLLFVLLFVLPLLLQPAGICAHGCGGGWWYCSANAVSDFRRCVGGVVSGIFFATICTIHAQNLLAVTNFFASFICRQLHPLYLLCPAQSRGFLVLMKSRKSPPSNNFEKHCHFMWQRASTCWISAGLLIAVADVVTAGFQRSS